MTHSVQLIRLLASVVIAFAACSFVVFYDHTSAVRFPFDHPDANGYWTESVQFVLLSRPPVAEFVTAHRTHAYAVPLTGLLLGIVIIWRRPQFHALTEVVVSAMWVLGLVWAGFIVIIWQMQNIPLFHGMRWNY